MADTATWIAVQTRLPAEEAEQLEELAKRNERSVAQEMRLVLRAHIAGQTSPTAYIEFPKAAK
jgi:predicted DNA-binding protein